MQNDDGLEVLRQIILGIRATVASSFVVGIKLNAGDYSEDTSQGYEPDRALRHVLEIATWGGVDFIEISGGDYESPGEFQSFTRQSQTLKRYTQNS